MRKTLLTLSLILLALIGSIHWYLYFYPQLSFLKISIDRQQALTLSDDFLKKQGFNPKEFHSAAIFSWDDSANRYIQKTLGFDGLKNFCSQERFDMFFWLIRYFKEGEKEDFRLTVSSTDGRITAFSHAIEETKEIPLVEKESALATARSFLKEKFGFNESLYTLNQDTFAKHDHRTDYSFAWQKNSVSVPWTSAKEAGTAKLQIGITVSGQEILGYYLNGFVIPEDYNRSIDKKMKDTFNVIPLLRNLHYLLLTAAIFYILLRRNHLTMHLTRRFYFALGVVTFLLSMSACMNQMEFVLFNYDTNSPFNTYFVRLILDLLVGVIFVTFEFMLPGLAGESLRHETLPKSKNASFLHLIQTSFFTRTVSAQIVLGYSIFIILLGLQSAITQWGENALGVWVEHSWVANLTSNYWPFLAVLAIAFKVSIAEEIIYRLFAITLFNKILSKWIKHEGSRLTLSVILSALLWGFSHTTYPIFPMWFRGIEVSILGFFLGWIYLRFGLITVIVAHFLFDAFWSCSGYLLGNTSLSFAVGSWVIMFLPLMWAFVAFILNHSDAEKNLSWQLNAHQRFNCDVLTHYLNTHQSKFVAMTQEDLRRELIDHGWDVAVVEMALENWTRG